MRRIISSLLASLLIILSFTPAIQQANAAILSAWGTPTIDGVVNPSEWSSAATIPFSFNSGANKGTVYLMNDALNLYIGLVVTDTAIDPNDGILLVFDNDNGGESGFEQGDDRLEVNAFSNFRDMFYRISDFFFHSDTISGGTINGFSKDSRIGSTNHFEFSHPLNSADNAHDFSLSIGQLVGFIFIIEINGVPYWLTGEDPDNPITWTYDYQVASSPGRPHIPPSSVAVGGIMIPSSILSILSPYLVLISLACIVSTILIKRKKHKN